MSIIEEYYVVSAAEVKSDKQVFIGTDLDSGGYYYWASNISSATRFKEQPGTDTISRNNYMLNGITNIKACKVQLSIIEEIDLDDVDYRKKLEKINVLKEQLRILEQDL